MYLNRLWIALALVAVVATGAVRHAAAAVPIANDDIYSVPENGTLTVDAPGLLANDTGNGLTVDGVVNPAHGSLVASADGSFTYTPDAGVAGTDSFAYVASDGVDTDDATVTIDVTNNPPVGGDDYYTTAPGTPLIVSAPGILANDSDPDGDQLIIDWVSKANHGPVVMNADGSFTYTPDPGFFGLDGFYYNLSDGTDIVTNIAVDILVEGSNDQAPVAVDDAYSTPQDTPLVIAAPGVLANDSDPDGDPLFVISANNTSNGTVVVNSDGSFAYTPNPGFVGFDAFAYSPSDGEMTALAKVSIIVDPAPVNHAPVANDDTYSTPQDTPLTVSTPGILANDTDVDGDQLYAANGGLPSHGILAGPYTDGAFKYTPDPGFVGDDSFTYRAYDGSVNGNVATVTIHVTADSPPVGDGGGTPTPDPSSTPETGPTGTPTDDPSATPTTTGTDEPGETPTSTPTDTPDDGSPGTEEDETPTATPDDPGTESGDDEPTATPTLFVSQLPHTGGGPDDRGSGGSVPVLLLVLAMGCATYALRRRTRAGRPQ